MRCQILHESKGRIRVHLIQYRMTVGQADILDAFLRKTEGVRDAVVYERTADAVIFYDGDRQRIIDALSHFDYESAGESVDNSSRQMSHDYEGKLVFHVLKRAVKRLFFPVPLRMAVTVLKSVKFICQGLNSLAHGKIEVSVLDATGITVSLLTGNFKTAGDIMFLLGLSEILEEWTHKKSVADLARSMSLNVDKVWMIAADGQEVLVPINDIRENDMIVIRTSSTIPLDGTVVSGSAGVNQASLTGESLPVRKDTGSYVYAGTVIDEGEITVQVKNISGSGRYDRIVRMIEDSEKLKSDTENQAARLADKLVPWSLGLTAITYLLTRSTPRALAALMVDYSCALKLSMPIAVLSAMREASTYRISVKGGKFLELAAQADTIVFDKTGTLTESTPKVAGIYTFGDYDADEILRLAACLEEHYPHSIANAVVEAAKEKNLVHEEKHSKVEYVVAHGIVSSIGGRRVLLGSYHFLFEDEKCRILKKDQKKFDSVPEEYSHLYMAIGKRLVAVICIEDPIRKEAASVISRMRELGIGRQVMMTGDSRRTAASVAAKVGVDEYHAEVLPEDKAVFIEKEHAEGRRVIMIGDGVNDTPALAAADVAVAISNGAPIAREIADVTLSGENLESLAVMRELSCALMNRIHSNYRFIMTFNSSLIMLGLLGIMPPSLTAYMHNMSTLALSAYSMTNVLKKQNA